MKYICGKCGNNTMFTQAKGGNTGLYCRNCGKWIKWLAKDELRAFEHNEENKNSTFDKTADDAIMETTMREKLIEFMDHIEKEIDSEYSKLPNSLEELIRKNVYCHTLEKVRKSIQNILSGYGFDDDV